MELKIILENEILTNIIGSYLECLLTEPVQSVKIQLTEEGYVLTTVVLGD